MKAISPAPGYLNKYILVGINIDCLSNTAHTKKLVYPEPEDACGGDDGDDAEFAEKENEVADGIDGGDATRVQNQSRKGRTSRSAKRLPIERKIFKVTSSTIQQIQQQIYNN